MTPTATKLYRISFPQHEVVYRGYSTKSPPTRYTVPARVMDAGGVTPADAARRIAQYAHHEAGIPHFRQLVDQTVVASTAVEILPPNHKPAK